ncbi:type II toxin-antitoxin system RelE/ParE family toxin [Paracidovorax citrulli]
MTARVVVLAAAEADLRDLRSYIVKNFGTSTWRESYGELKDALRRIARYPDAGKIPDELAALNLAQYRQIIAGMNRVIYEVRGDTVFVHVICDTRRDLRTLLMRHILRSS